MRILRLILLFTVLLLALPGAQGARYKEIGPARVYQVQTDFETARDNLKDAIEGRGMVISYVSHAQAMLDRTAPVVGKQHSVYGKAEILLFCKANLSHRLVEANPHNIVLCPYAIAVYTLRAQPGVVYYAYRKPYLAEPAFRPIVKLLDELIAEAIEAA